MFFALLVAVSFAPLQREAAKYWKEITGREIPVGAIRFAIDPAVSRMGHDAYHIVSTDGGACITGMNMRSVWYGLYDLFEQRGGCRWFWDGDIVPKKPRIDLSNLDVYEEAGFRYRAIRYFAHRGLTRFQAEHWGIDDWRREIDWCLKQRLNVFMLRIGQDDLFQRAFPEDVPYPDPVVPLAGAGKGYDNRSLFWSLEYRGRLRAAVQSYGRERGLMIPEDFGTMTHWYSRTPVEFLEKQKPLFLPQATRTYSEKSGLVWDVRDPKWVDAYWKLTETAVDAYGGGRPELLHTIGLGERRCFTNRADNLNLKIKTLKTFIAKARSCYPDAKILLAGWDFYFTWRPEEVRALLSQLDQSHVVIWDYEGDATTDGCADMKGVNNNFTKWGVVGKFPYTYSMFLAYESALDVRANYPLIEERFKLVKDDPLCEGFLLWPEASHTDTLALQYFTENAWSRGHAGIGKVLDEFCKGRYGKSAHQMRSIWQKTIPISHLIGWGGNYGRSIVYCLDDIATYRSYETPSCLTNAVPVLNALSEVAWNDAFVHRDVVDIARTIIDRAISDLCGRLMRLYGAWCESDGEAEPIIVLTHAYDELGDIMADLLELHTDYSLWESLERLNAVERVGNPHFDSVLLDNAACDYCHSHQYELARYWYAPVMHGLAECIRERVLKGDHERLGGQSEAAKRERERLMRLPLRDLRPRAERTPENFRRVVLKAAEAFSMCK